MRRYEQRNDDGTATICDIDLERGTVSGATVSARPARILTSPLEFENERYDVEAIVGRGGFADVVRAFDRRLNRVVALKIPRRDLAGLRAEGELAARLQHPNIVPVYDAGEGADGSPYYAMKLLDGSSLKEVICEIAAGDEERSERFGLPRLLEAFRQVCLAVEYAHHQGLLHRDIKPANVILGQYGEVVLADWGIARRVDATDDDGGLIRGTLAYMAPERFDDEPHGTIASDVYALGAMLYEVLALVPPRQGTMDQILEQVLAGPPEPPSAITARAVPAPLESVAMRALHTDPRARPKSAGALADAVAGYLDAQRDATTRRRRAASAFDEARQALERYRTAIASTAALEREISDARGRLAADAALEQRRLIWRQEAAIQASRVEREVRFGLAVSAFEQVLHDDEDHVMARAGLSQIYWERLTAAESADDPVGAARYQQLIRAAGHPAFEHRMSERTVVWVRCSNGAAEVSLSQHHRVGPIYEALPVDASNSAGQTDLHLSLLPGSYTARYEMRGYAPMSVPFVVRRGEVFTVNRRMYLAEAVPRDFVPVTGLEHDFALQRHPVTVAEFLAFANTEQAAGRSADDLVPSELGGLKKYFASERGVWTLKPEDDDGDQWSRSWPMLMVTRGVAERYAAYLSGQLGLSVRLPTKEEWEWAASGPDGRAYPWGPGADVHCANVRHPGINRARPLPVGSFSLDCSVFGVCDMAGGVSEWTSTTDADSGVGVLKGASYNAQPENAQVHIDRFARPNEGFSHYGMRMCCDLGLVHNLPSPG